jgi:hypothetical protein
MSTFFRRLAGARVWIVLQFVLTLILLLLGLAWTRLPDKHAWQVALTLLVPVLLAISFLELQAGTMRKLADDDGHRVKLVWGAVTLLLWIAVFLLAWRLFDWADDQIPQWSDYIHSLLPKGLRASLLTGEHIQSVLFTVEWIFRWVVVPAKLIPLAAASAQSGLRLPWRRVIGLLWNWRWWAGVIVAAVVAILPPSHLFNALPTGSVAAQEWHVLLKMVAVYLLAMGSWVLLLGWQAALFAGKQAPPSEEALVAVPVLTGPPDRDLSAKVDVPSEGESR